MKKVSLLFAALMVSAFVLTSCGGGKSGEAKDTTKVETPAPDSTAAQADTTHAQ